MDSSIQPFKAIFLTGCQNAGKKVAAQILARTAAGHATLVIDSFGAEMRERCHGAYKLLDSRNLPAHPGVFQQTIDQPSPYFGDKSPRVAYAEFAEFMQKSLGRDIAGKWMVERLSYYRQRAATAPTGVIIFDAAPLPAYQQMLGYVGVDNCTELVVCRDGKRMPPTLGSHGVRFAHVMNPGDTVAAFESAIRKAAPHLYIEIAREI